MVVVSLSMSDIFEIFGLSPCYNIDLQDLEDRFRRGQGLVHPDRFVAKSMQERTAAARQAVKLNESYQILKDPLKRAAAFLAVKGIKVPGDNGATVNHPALLGQVMQWREGLESCKSESELAVFESELSGKLESIKSAFDTNEETLDYLYLELVYISKILEEIRFHPLRKPNVCSAR